MQTNLNEEHNFHQSNFDHYERDELVEVLARWLKEQRKSRKDPSWNSLLFCLAKILMPDVEMGQLLIENQFFIEKMNFLLGQCKFRTQTLFNGTEVKLGETFIAFDTECKLQKVIMQGTQIKQVSPTQPFTSIVRSDMTCSDRKKRMFIYNRQKSKPTTFLTIEIKSIERTKHDLFKQDHGNKMKFFTNFVFGQYCPSFCVSGINMIKVKENQWLKEKVHLKAGSVYLIYEGTFVCFLESFQSNDQNKEELNNRNSQQVQASPIYFSAKRSKRNFSAVQNCTQSTEFINKIQLNKGSIIESSSFQQTLAKLGQKLTHKFQSCKAITNTLIFEIKCSEFYRAMSLDERCKRFFLSQYQKVLFSRKQIFSQSLTTLNNFFHQTEQHITQAKLKFPMSRQKSSKGFRTTRQTSSNLEDIEGLTSVDVYETIIKNKEKVLSLQRQYESKKISSVQKGNLRYEDNKKLKENYKRMKIKDFQIQKLIFRNSVSNIKDSDGFKNVKSRFGQVKGIFQDEIEPDANVLKLHRRTMFQEDNKENKQFKRKEKKQKSYTPETNKPSFFNQSLTCSRTCQHTPRVSLNQQIDQNLFKQIRFAENRWENVPSSVNISEGQINSRQTMRQYKMRPNNPKSSYEIDMNSKKYLNVPQSCNSKRDIKRIGRKIRTFFKRESKREQKFETECQPNIAVTSFVKLV